jgi:hypothetical protein
MVAHEFFSGRTIRLWEDELRRLRVPPFPIGRDSLFVSFFSTAELGCFLELSWPLPETILDLFVEFRNLTNGLLVSGNSLISALSYFGFGVMDAAVKDNLRELAIRGGHYSEGERLKLLDYCQSDVMDLRRLIKVMESRIDWPRALIRGRSMRAFARIERTGIPIDVESLEKLKFHWEGIKQSLIDKLDTFGVYDGTTFKNDRFESYLIKNNIGWPMLDSGRLALDDDSFKDMARVYPHLEPLRQLRYSLAKMHLNDLQIGSDHRNRCMLSPFRAKTSRNYPSNSKFIFGPGVWLRFLIQPPPGWGLAYIDWSQQEFGIASRLSSDERMQEAYRSADADPYLSLAKLAGAVPSNGTKAAYKLVRDQFKQCCLGIQYAMEYESLAARINQPRVAARQLIQQHREAFRKFWEWSDAVVDTAMLYGELKTVFGWTLRAGPQTNPRTFRNYPMQGNAAEMLRLAISFITEAGIDVCAPVQDAILVQAPLDKLDETIHKARHLMAKASRIILSGFELRTEVMRIPDPKRGEFADRYWDERGEEMWRKVWETIGELEPQFLN